jgi:transcriptional regulator with XRE-family HTH domain
MQPEVVKIKQLMRDNDMSVADLAKEIGVSRQNVYRWLNGTKPISRKRIEQLGNVFGKHPSTIMFDGIAPIDKPLLQDVIEIVNDKATELGVEISSKDFARICVLLYEFATNSKDESTDGRPLADMDLNLAKELVLLAS